MVISRLRTVTVADVAEAAARQLVTVRHWGESTFINLPMIYPSGSFVTVKLDQMSGGVRVSDNGFAYRELESHGVQRSFAKTVASIAEIEDLQVNSRAIFVDVAFDHLVGAICDVGMASQRTADRIISRINDEDESLIEDHLRERLLSVFGTSLVREAQQIKGLSTSEWDVSALVELPDHLAVFHAVSSHANSVFKASTAFHDLSALERPPTLVAVVKDKRAFGPKLSLLSQAGRVIEEGQPDEVYQRAAA